MENAAYRGEQGATVRIATIKDFQGIVSLCLEQAIEQCKLRGLALRYIDERFVAFDIAPTRIQLKKMIEDSNRFIAVADKKGMIIGCIFGTLIMSQQSQNSSEPTYQAYINKLVVSKLYHHQRTAYQLIRGFRCWVADK